MFRIDHHIHTTRYSPDSVMDPIELVERAKAVGLSGVGITEHDCLWPEDELAELQAAAGDLLVLAGVEVSALEGHFLVYGLKSLDGIEPGISLRRLIAIVHRAEAAIVAAHPYRWEQEFDEIFDAHGHGLHGIELVSNNVTHQTRARAERLLERHPFPTTGSSDAHHSEVVGCYFTEFPQRIENLSQFVSALRSGTAQPGHRPGAILTSGPVHRAPARRAAARA